MSKEDIDKLDKQIELLKNENNKKVVEKVTTEIKDEEDPNHVINIDYIDSEVNEATKELKDLKNLTENVVEEKLEDTKKMNINEDNKIIIEEVEDNDSIEEGITVEKNGKKIVKLNKKTIFILSFIIGFLITVLIGCIIIFSNDDKDKELAKENDKEEVKELTEKEMINIINLYGKSLEKEIDKYFVQNNKLPDFSTINNLVDLDNEVVCLTHEIYEDKTIYLDECMVDYKDVNHRYGTKKEIKEEVVDNNNVKVYVHRHTKEATLVEPKDIENYILYSSNVDGEIHNLTLIQNTSYLIYYDYSQENPYGVVYNYILGKKALNKIDYKHATVLRNSQSECLPYAVLYSNDDKGKIYNLITGNPISKEYDTVYLGEISKERIVVGNDNKFGLLNYVTGNEIIPLEYDSVSSSGNSIIGLKIDTAYIFDEDGNQYLTNISKDGFHRSMVVDRYVFSGKKLYNINGNAVCEFELEYPITTKYGVTKNDNVIYHIESNKVPKCLVYNVSSKECSVVNEEECPK